MENETDEQFEERVLNKRAAQLFFSVKARMIKQESLWLSDMTVRNSRKQVYIYKVAKPEIYKLIYFHNLCSRILYSYSLMQRKMAF